MNKYAFIVNVPGLTAEKYEETFNDGEWISHVAGFDGIDACMDYAKKLIDEGYCMLNFSGAFGQEQVDELMKAAPEETDIHYAGYTPEQSAKLEALDQYREYGMIIFGNVTEPVRFELDSPQMHTRTTFIADLDQAVEVAKGYVAEGVDGIELCGSFDPDMTQTVIAEVEAVDKKIPVGSNGLG